MSAPKPVVMLTVDELHALVREAVRAELGAVAQAEEREVLTREQAAELLQVHPTVLVRYVKRDGLPALKVGPEWRFRRSELLAWLEARAVRPGAPLARAARQIRSVKGAS